MGIIGWQYPPSKSHVDHVHVEYYEPKMLSLKSVNQTNPQTNDNLSCLVYNRQITREFNHVCIKYLKHHLALFELSSNMSLTGCWCCSLSVFWHTRMHLKFPMTVRKPKIRYSLSIKTFCWICFMLSDRLLMVLCKMWLCILNQTGEFSKRSYHTAILDSTLMWSLV